MCRALHPAHFNDGPMNEFDYSPVCYTSVFFNRLPWGPVERSTSRYWPFFSSFLFGFGEKRLNGGPPSRHIKWRRKHRYDGCLMRSIDFSINFKWSRLVLNTKRCLISKLEPFKSPAGRELRASSVSSTIISSFNSIFCAHRSICLQISLRCFLWIKSDSGEALGRKKNF